MTDGLASSVMGLRLAGNPFFILQFGGKWGGGRKWRCREGRGGVIRAQRGEEGLGRVGGGRKGGRGEEAHRRQSTNRIPQATVPLSDDVKETHVLIAVVVVVSLMSR